MTWVYGFDTVTCGPNPIQYLDSVLLRLLKGDDVVQRSNALAAVGNNRPGVPSSPVCFSNTIL